MHPYVMCAIAFHVQITLTRTHSHSHSFHIVSDERILGHALIENEYYEHRLFIAVQRSMKWMVLIAMFPMFGFC